jgi:hypothetical protein
MDVTLREHRTTVWVARPCRRPVRPHAIFWGVLALLFLWVSNVHADATTYSSNKRSLRVGVLLLDSTGYNWSTTPPSVLPGGAENPDPHLFHIADSRADVKPANWEFVNPLAPKTVTTDIWNRWSRPGTGRDPGHPYRIGQQVAKNMACYWEVSLTNTSLEELLQFDLLFVTNHRTVYLTPADREKLRNLVDAGGVVWFEDCGRMKFHPLGPFFLEQVQFTSGGGNGAPSVHVPTHPILTNPHALSFEEIAELGDANYRNGRAIASIAPGSILPNEAPVLERPNPSVLVNVVGNTAVRSASGEALPYIAAGNYGAGAVVVTAGDSGCDINDYCGGINAGFGGNSGAFCGPNLTAARTADLKFLYNVVAWGSANNAYRRNNRRSGASLETVGAPLLDGFAARGTAIDPAVSSSTAPLLIRGLVVVAGQTVATAGAGSSVLRAYVAQPSGAAGDRGIPDLMLGNPWDEVWRVALPGGKPSSPIAASIHTGGPVPLDVVFVTLSDGTLVRVPVEFRDSAGNLLPSPPVDSNPPIALEGTGAYARTAYAVAPAPVFFENRVYVVEPDGMLRCVDARSMQTLWWSHTEVQSPKLTPTGTPALGVSRQDAVLGAAGRPGQLFAARSGGNTNDIMLYVPVVDEDLNASVLSYFLGTRHEVVRIDDGASGNYRTRVALDTNAPATNRQFVAVGDPRFLLPRVRIYDNDSAMAAGLPSTSLTGVFRTDGSGIVEVRDSTGGVPTANPRPIVSVDYDVVYVTSSQVPPGLGDSNGARTGQPLTFPRWTGSTADRSGLDTVSLTRDDDLFLSLRQSNDTYGARVSWLVSISEQFGLGTTRFRQSIGFIDSDSPVNAKVDKTDVTDLPTLRNRLVFNGPISASISATVAPNWEGLTNIEPIGSPIVANTGTSYALYSATSGANGGTVSVLVAVKAGDPVVLSLPEAYNPAFPVTVRQFNIMTWPGSGGNVPQTLTAILPAVGNDAVSSSLQLSGDPKRGRIVVTDMRHPSGARFSATQSFVVTYTPSGTQSPLTVVLTPMPVLPGGTTTGDEGSVRVIGGNYNPVLWYYVLPGRPTAGPTLSGGHVYLVVDANLVAVDADPSENDPGVRPGFGEQVMGVAGSLVDAGTGTPVPIGVNHVRWVRSMGSAAVGAPVVGDGVVAVNTIAGTRAYQAATTLVADSKRLIEVAADGSAVWTLDSSVGERVAGGELPVFDPTQPTGILNPPATGRTTFARKELSKPSAVRKLSGSDYLIADTGNHRVLRVDRSGRIRWEMSRMNDVFGILSSGDPITLDSPTDVRLYFQETVDPSAPAGAPIGYEVHYLVADSGNYRVVEVVDYFDRNGAYRTIGGRKAEQVVVWVSRTKSKEGRPLRFVSAQRVITTNNGIAGIPLLVAVVANTSAAGTEGVDSDFAGGSVVRLDYRPYNTWFTLRNLAGNVLPPAVWPAQGMPVGSGFPWAPVAGNVLASENARNGLVETTLNEMVLPNGRVRRVNGPTYFEQLTLPGPTGLRQVSLICDSEGVWQLEPDATGRRLVTWSFEQSHYDQLNTVPAFGENSLESRLAVGAGVAVGAPSLPRLRPTSVRRLFNGNYLITNSWSGPCGWFVDGLFHGEVFEVEPLFLTGGVAAGGRFGGFAAPKIRPIRNANPALNRNQQSMGSTSSNTSLIEQPLSADRP